MNKQYAVFMALGFECVGVITALLYLGRYLDQNHGWNGLGAGLGAVVGFVGWLTHVIVLLRKFQKEEELREAQEAQGLKKEEP